MKPTTIYKISCYQSRSCNPTNIMYSDVQPKVKGNFLVVEENRNGAMESITVPATVYVSATEHEKIEVKPC